MMDLRYYLAARIREALGVAASDMQRYLSVYFDVDDLKVCETPVPSLSTWVVVKDAKGNKRRFRLILSEISPDVGR